MNHVRLRPLMLMLLVSLQLSAEKAVVIVPVADLVGQPIRDFFKHHATQAAYHRLPWWPGSGSTKYVCPRLNQLLFNEVVEILKAQGNEILIRIPHAFYLTGSDKRPQTDYWTLKHTVMPFSELAKQGIDPSTIPEPLNFQRSAPFQARRPIVTLTHPAHDPITKQTFSAGTRFVMTDQQPPSHHVMVYAIDPHSRSLRTISLDKKLTRMYEEHTSEQRVKDFVELLRAWAHANSIPYVWGGCSFIRTYHPESCQERATVRPDYPSTPILENNIPKTGLDCSGLVTRAAQIVGIPYFFKNTYTLANSLPPLGIHDHISEGDLIWVPRHVMVVSNRARNLLVEARTYDSGYGRVHEIELSRVFKDVKTYNDLERMYRTKQPLKRFNCKGEISDIFYECKIFRIGAVWKL